MSNHAPKEGTGTEGGEKKKLTLKERLEKVAHGVAQVREKTKGIRAKIEKRFADRAREQLLAEAHGVDPSKASFSYRLSLMIRGLSSRDRITRRYARIYWLSILGVVVSSVWGYQRVQRIIDERDAAKELAALIAEAPEMPIEAWAKFEGIEGARRRMLELRDKARDRDIKDRTYSLGEFTLELAPVPGAQPYRGVLQQAEIEIMVECDSVPTCAYISKYLPVVRNQVTNVLTPLDRREILTRDGKRRLKKAVIDRLNAWIGTAQGGAIRQVHFTKLLLT